jgi:hypothetical protein
MADGFLGRWSRRKQDVRAGRPLAEPVVAQEVAEPEAPPAAVRASQPAVPESQAGRPVQPAQPPAPPPTLDDAQALTPQSDFRRFVTADVDPQVRNAAVKKLFADPHFNVMDGLDIYIDDYSRPDPLPQTMLRRMASAQFLNLVEQEPTAPSDNAQASTAAGGARMLATDSGPEPSPPSQARPSATTQTAEPQPTIEDHADTDLRLQQDHAAGAPGSGGRPE